MSKMKPFQLICQNCNIPYKNIKDFKAHVRNYRHKQEVTQLFQTAVHKGPVYFPIFVFLDYLRTPNQTDLLIGFDMVTMFITPEKIGAFYLCHVCEEQLSSGDVLLHLCSNQHYFRYLAYTNPELLCFAWLEKASSYLQSSAKEEYKTHGPGNIRVIELPKSMLGKCKELPYHEVISVFSKTDKLMECIKVGLPQRKSIQEYISDPNRAKPLLGLDLLLEYSCPKNEGYCGYLCILCKEKLSATESISHLFSFDHIYQYLKAAHPATLGSPRSSYYQYSYSFCKMILYLASQAQTIHPPTEIQSVHLNLECFKVVNSSSYATALEKLQVIWRERNQGELNVSITPGERLMFASESQKPSASTATTDSSAEQQEKKTQMEGPVTQTRDDLPCRILCVECDKKLNLMKDYKKHIEEKQHKQKLIELFGPGQYSGAISQIKLYQYMWNCHNKKSLSPIIGLPLLTVFIQRPSLDCNVPFYLCHACELNIPVSTVSSHLTSTQHFFNVFSCSKPDLIFFGSRDLKQCAQEEALSQGKQEMVLQVCELPSQHFTELRTLAYEKIMAILGKYFSKLRKCIQVEKQVTLQSYSTSCERKAPLLGLQFMVKYTTAQHYFRCRYLCLLCEKNLPQRQAIAHVLSSVHVISYLKMAHPGSLSEKDSEQVSLIMDLAQQAEKITPNMTLQEIKGVEVSIRKFIEIEKSSYKSAVNVLQGVFRGKGLGELKPSVVPGARLVSSFKTNKEINSSAGGKQGHTEVLNIDATNTDTPMVKSEEEMNSKHPDLLCTEHEELLTTPHISSICIQPAEPSLATTHSDSKASQPLIPSIHEEQSEPQKMDQITLNKGLPDHNSTEDIPTVKYPNSGELAQTPVVHVESLQKPPQSPAGCKAEPPAVSQHHLSTCTELRSYLKAPNEQPVIGTHSNSLDDMICSAAATNSSVSPAQCLLVPVPLYEPISPPPASDCQDVTNVGPPCSYPAPFVYEPVSPPPALDSNGLADVAPPSSSTPVKPTQHIPMDEPPDAFKRETEEKCSPCAHLKETVKDTEPDTEPETPKQDTDDSARSSPYLWSYLKSPTRTEPVIGLDMVTEYRISNGQNSFLCSCCNIICKTQAYTGHLISPRHRFNYIKSKQPELVANLKCGTSFSSNISQLRQKAQIVQDTEGWGCLKVVEKEMKQPKKKIPQPSEDTEIEISAMVQKQDPSQTNEPQDLKGSERKPKKQHIMNKMNKQNAGIDLENSVKVQKLKPSKSGHEAEQQDHNSHEPKPTKEQQKKKITKRKAEIGLDFVTCVRYDRKVLFFCELCSVRGQLDHMSSVAHRKTYMEHKYPGWTASGTNMEKKLYKIALHLAEVERRTGTKMKKLNVTAKDFTALRTAPLNNALNHLKLLQTKQEDGVDLKTSSFQPEPNIFLHNEHGTHSNSLDDMICSATTSNSSVSPAQCLLVPVPLYEPISPPPASDCQDVTNVGPPCSYPAPFVYEPVSPPPALDSNGLADVAPPSSSTPVKPTQNIPMDEPPDVAGPVHHKTGQSVSTLYAETKGASGSEISQSAFPYSAKSSHLMCSQSILREESKLLHDTPPLKTFCFPNLPKVLEQSYASVFLNVMGPSKKDPIIGLSNMLECRRISQPTFYLCLNCAEKVSKEIFYNHLTSEQHQYLSIRTQYHEKFQHWQCQTIHQMTIRDLAEELALAEKGFDAKVIKLNEDQYESLYSADFHEAIEILQRIFGPCLDESSEPSHLVGEDQRSNEISTVKSPPESVEAETEKDNQLQQTCDNSAHIQELHNSKVTLKEFDSAESNFARNTAAYTSIQNQRQWNQSSPKALPESNAQTPQPQDQSVLQTDLTVEPASDSRKSLLHSSKLITKRAKENPAIGNSLKHTGLMYRNKNSAKQDAVVGLSALIECRSEGQASLYLCVSCSKIIDHDLIHLHLVKPGHRHTYLKKRYPSLFEDWPNSDSKPEWSMRLMRLAHQVEMTNEDEPGQLQVMNLNCENLKEIKTMPYDQAIKHLQKIRKEQNLCDLNTCIFPKITKRLIKQERMETDEPTQCSAKLPGMISQEPIRAFKCKAKQVLPHQCLTGKEQCSDVPSSHMKLAPLIENNQDPSDFPVKRRKISGSDSDSFTQLQKESSVLNMTHPNRSSLVTVLDTSRSSPRNLDPSSHTNKITTFMDKTMLKNGEDQESSCSFISPQQRDSNSSPIWSLSSISKGQEIARWSEKRPLVKKSLSEDAWNYENRQFSNEKPSLNNTNPVAELSTDIVDMKQQCITYSLPNYNEALNPHYNQNIPDDGLNPSLTHNANPNLYQSMVSSCGTETSFTTQVAPEYAMSHQYAMYQHPEDPYVTAVTNTVPPVYLMDVDERDMNCDVASIGISTNGAYLMDTNSAQTSHIVHQSQKVYQPIQAFQNPLQAHYAWYYNQALQNNQTAAEPFKPAFEQHAVYPLASWPQKKE